MLSRWLWWRPPCLLRTVIVNQKGLSDVALRGVLWSYRGGWLTLRPQADRPVEALNVGAEPTPLDGDVVIHRSNVAFLQVLP